MTDIGERLRKGVDNDGYHHLIDAAEKTMQEAADEIERLRGALNKIELACKVYEMQSAIVVISKLANDALKESE